MNTEVFRKPRSQLLNLKNSWASPTPIVDGDRVYVHFGAEGTAALTTAGELVWQAHFPYAVAAWRWRVARRSTAIC